MPDPDPSASTDVMLADNSTQAWDELATRVDSLIGAWQSGPRPPVLGKFLPENPAGVRRIVLCELIKVDLEYRWQQHSLPKTIEEYLAEFPELADGGVLPCDLIYEEYLIRRHLPERARGGRLSQAISAQDENADADVRLEANLLRDDHNGRRRSSPSARRGPADRRFRRARAARRRGVCFGVSGPATLDGAARGLESLARPRQRIANAGPVGPSRHRAGVRSAHSEGAAAAADVYAACVGRHVARRAAEFPGCAGRRAQRQDDARGDRRSARQKWPIDSARFQHAPSIVELQLAIDGLLARHSARRGPRSCASAGCVAPRCKAGQCAARSRRCSEAGRLQRQLQFEAGRRHAGRLFRRQPGLHVARATRGEQPG